MLVVAQCQKCNAAAEQDGNVKDYVCFGHLLERCRIQTVQSTMKNGKSSHHPNGLAVSRYVAIKVPCH